MDNYPKMVRVTEETHKQLRLLSVTNNVKNLGDIVSDGVKLYNNKEDIVAYLKIIKGDITALLSLVTIDNAEISKDEWCGFTDRILEKVNYILEEKLL